MTRTEHIPLYAKRVVQDPVTYSWCGEVVDDKKKFKEYRRVLDDGIEMLKKHPNMFIQL